MQEIWSYTEELRENPVSPGTAALDAKSRLLFKVLHTNPKASPKGAAEQTQRQKGHWWVFLSPNLCSSSSAGKDVLLQGAQQS